MVNWDSALAGGASGAAVGTALNPGWGTAIGAAGGFITGLFGKKKKKPKPKKYSTLDPQQEELYGNNMAALRGEGPLAGLYNFDEEGYNDVFDKTIGRPAYRKFQENVIPSITGQFRGNNIGNSSYTGEALSRAGRDVQENLDAQRSSNIFSGQQNAQNNKANAVNNMLGMQTFAYSKPGAQEKNSIDTILENLTKIGGDWLANKINGSTSKPAAKT